MSNFAADCIFVKTSSSSFTIKIRNTDNCSVFRSELIANEKSLKAADFYIDSKNIWTENRSYIQHFQNWSRIGDRASISRLDQLQKLSSCHDMHLQWIPSHIGLNENEVVDTLAKEWTSMALSSNTLTFLKISSKLKSTVTSYWCPMTHDCHSMKQ